MSEGKPLSNGQVLLKNKKLVQASCFLASIIPMETRLAWSNSLAKPSLRSDRKKLKDSSIFLVLSQNCDIACRDDKIESTVEIAICKKIKAKDVHDGNSFVKSVRKLHFQANEHWYEANVDNILSIDKGELLEALDATKNFSPINLSGEFSISVPVWRSNRYLRSALPDLFNAHLFPVLDSHIKEIEDLARADELQPYSSYIRAIYVWIDSFEEKDNYSFDLFALLRDDISDAQASKVQDAVESMAENLSNSSGYNDESNIYAGTESTVTVAYLTKFVRLNLDHHSLRNKDNDTGQELP